MGRVEVFELSVAPQGESPRKVYVYLPNSYDRTKKKYDVLYMFDGHNLFSDETATYGKSWGIREYLDQTGLDLVVIGQDCNHTGSKRMDEYCPLPAERLWGEKPIYAEGDVTADWFVNVLKKECEKRYRIYKDRKHVGIGGSSMGGLMAQYMIAGYNRVYSKAACVSPAHYFCLSALKNVIAEAEYDENTRIYMDLGTKERSNTEELVLSIDLMQELCHMYEERGCHTWPHLVMGGSHNEASWETIVPLFLQFLYPELY